MSSVIKLLILSVVVTLNKGELYDESDVKEQLLIKKIYNQLLPRQSGYGLVKFEGNINQDTNQNDFGRVTFDDQGHRPLRFENQNYQSLNPYQSMGEPTFPTANLLGSANINQELQNIQNTKKKKRRRKPRLQQSQIPHNQQNYYGFQRPNSHDVLAGFRPPRRSPQSTWSTILAALTSVTVNDDLQCIPMLVCQAAAKGLFGNSTILQFSQLNSLLAAYGSVSSSPIFVFGRAAILGMTAKNNPESCIPQYPLCPKDPEQLVNYLNNHNGGFFKFFKPPNDNPIMPGSYGLMQPQQAAAVPNNVGQYYGLYPPNNNLLQPQSQYVPPNYAPSIQPSIEPLSNYMSKYQDAEYGLLSTHTPKYPFYAKSKEVKQENEATTPNQEVKKEGNPVIITRAHNHKHKSKHSRNRNHKRKHGHSKHKKRKRGHRHHSDEDRRYSRKDRKAKRDRQLALEAAQYLTIEDSNIPAPVPNVLGNDFDSPMNVADLYSMNVANMTSTRIRRSATMNPYGAPNMQTFPIPSNSGGGLTIDQLLTAIKVVSKQDDQHCLPLILCENASRGRWHPYNLDFNNTDIYNYTIAFLRNLSDFGPALLYGLSNLNNTPACFKRYPNCDISGRNLVNYYRKKGFNMMFTDTNLNHFYSNFLRYQAGDDQVNWYGFKTKQQSNNYIPNNAWSPQLSSQQTFDPQMANQAYTQYAYNQAAHQYNPYNYLSPAQQVPLSNSYKNPSASSYPNGFGQVNYGNSFSRFRRSYSNDLYDTNTFQLSDVVDKQIQKRIQNKPEIFAEDPSYNFEPKWTFPDVESNDYGGVKKVRDNRHLKFPSEERESKEDLNRETRGFSFPEAQSNRPYYSEYNSNLDYNDDKSVRINTINSFNPHIKDEDEGDLVYIVRGNGDPYHPEIVRLRPGENITY